MNFSLSKSQNIKYRRTTSIRQQKGIALVFVLIMMTMVFSIAAISSRIATTGERVARADRDRQVALQAAEAAISDAELDIMDPTTTRGCSFPEIFAEPGCSANSSQRGVCVVDPTKQDTPVYKLVNFDEQDDDDRKYVRFGEFTGGDGRRTSFQAKNLNDSTSAASTVGQPADYPKYIIEKIPLSSGLYGIDETGSKIRINFGKLPHAFLVTAIGYGYSKSTTVMLQALIVKPVVGNGCA